MQELWLLVSVVNLTRKAPITTAADDKSCDIFSNFRKKIKQTILMEYHALFVIFEKVAKF